MNPFPFFLNCEPMIRTEASSLTRSTYHAVTPLYSDLTSKDSRYLNVEGTIQRGNRDPEVFAASIFQDTVPHPIDVTCVLDSYKIMDRFKKWSC